MKFLLLVLAVFLNVVTAIWYSPWQNDTRVNACPLQNYARHSSVAVDALHHDEHDFIFEFGGYLENQTASVLYGAAHSVIAVYAVPRIYDTVTKSWSTVVTDGPQPVARANFAMTLVNLLGQRVIYLFGGSGEGYANIKDSFWSYTVETNVFTNLTMPASTTFPWTRLGAGFATYRDGFYMFGGVGFDLEHAYNGTNEIWFYNATENTWAQQFFSGECPPPSWFSALFITESNPETLIIFGGETGDAADDIVSFTMDMYKVNLTTGVCSLVVPVTPVDRIRWHGATGLYQRNDDVNAQIIIQSGDYGQCQSLVLLDPSTTTYLIDANTYYDGLVPLYAAGPESKCAQLVCFKKGLCYQTGGFTGIECSMSQMFYLNDVYTYDASNRAFNLAGQYSPM